jgi:hypothetical protein
MRKTVWSRETNQDAAGAAMIAQADQYSDRHTQRKAEALSLYQYYEGIDALDGKNRVAEVAENGDVAAGVATDEPIDISLNVFQDIVDTLVSKIAGKEDNKAQIAATDASWEVRRQTILADRLVEAIMAEPQGKFLNAPDVFREGLRMALAATRTSAVKIYSDIPAAKVRLELHDTLSMWADTTGHPYDYPTQIGEVTYWDPERLCDMFPDSKYKGAEEAIFKAIRPTKHLGLEMMDDDHDYVQADKIERVPVYEAWRFKRSSSPGKYCMAIPNYTFRFDDYKESGPPFIFVGGVRAMTGFWHRTLTKPISKAVLYANQIVSRCKSSENLIPKAAVFFDPEEVAEEHMATTDDYIAIPVPGLAKGGKPQYEAPPPFHPLVLELAQFFRSQAYELSGVSQMHTAADVKGDWSGVALRIRKQLLDERFAPIHRAYMHATTVEASQHILRCAQEIYAANPKFKVMWRGDGYTKSIDASVLRVLDEHDYSVEVYTVSESKNTPEDRLQLMQELMQVGIVTGEAFAQAIRDYDVSSAQQTPDEQRQFIARQIDKWLFSPRRDMRVKGFYRPPFRTMQLLAAVAQVNRAYMKALTDEVDEFRLTLFKRFLVQCQDLIMKQAQRQGSAVQAAGGTAPAAAMVQQQQTGVAAPATAAAA